MALSQLGIFFKDQIGGMGSIIERMEMEMTQNFGYSQISEENGTERSLCIGQLPDSLNAEVDIEPSEYGMLDLRRFKMREVIKKFVRSYKFRISRYWFFNLLELVFELVLGLNRYSAIKKRLGIKSATKPLSDKAFKNLMKFYEHT